MTRREFNRTALLSLAASAFAVRLRARTEIIPPSSVDSHAHIFEHSLKFAKSRRYTPDYDATLPEYLSQLDSHGVAQGVLIQPSFLGTDNSYLRRAVRNSSGRLRGIAVVDPIATSGELGSLAEDGIVGIRLNLIGEPIPSFSSTAWQSLLGRVAGLGWQVEVQREAHDLPWIVDPLLDAGVKVVVDHFGRPDPKRGVDDPGFRYLLGVGASGRVWVKLSGYYRNGGVARGDAIARQAVPLLLHSFGAKRLLWGSDWPHTQFEKVASYDAAVAAMEGWLPEAGDRDVILRDSPRELFRFS